MTHIRWMLALALVLSVAALAEPQTIVLMPQQGIPLMYVANMGINLAPARDIAQALGATTAYDAATRAVTLTRGEHQVTCILNSRAVMVDGTTATAEAPAVGVQGGAWVPLRRTVEGLGGSIDDSNGVWIVAGPEGAGRTATHHAHRAQCLMADLNRDGSTVLILALQYEVAMSESVPTTIWAFADGKVALQHRLSGLGDSVQHLGLCDFTGDGVGELVVTVVPLLSAPRLYLFRWRRGHFTPIIGNGDQCLTMPSNSGVWARATNGSITLTHVERTGAPPSPAQVYTWDGAMLAPTRQFQTREFAGLGDRFCWADARTPGGIGYRNPRWSMPAPTVLRVPVPPTGVRVPVPAKGVRFGVRIRGTL